jgi:hypothetical protein
MLSTSTKVVSRKVVMTMPTKEEIMAAAERLHSPTYTPARTKGEKDAEAALENLKQAKFGEDAGYYDGAGILRVGREPYYDSNLRLRTPSTDPKVIRQEEKELERILREEAKRNRKR